MQLRITADTAKAERLLREAPAGLVRAISAWARQGGELAKATMQGVIVERAKQPTGQLAGSVSVNLTPTGAEVGPEKTYAPFVDQPTGIYGPRGQKYPIVPRTKKALAFPSKSIGGTDIRAGVVRVRESRGRPVGRLVQQGPFLPGGRFRSTGKGRGRPDVAGALAVVRGVMHPGSPGMHFVDETTRRVEQPLTRLLDHMMTAELQRLEGGP